MTEQAKTGVEAGDRALETLEPNHHWKWFRARGQVECPQKDQAWHKAEPQICRPCDYAKKTAEAYAELAMNAQERELARTLNNLKCEVVGWLGLARPMLIQELSITNVRVMEHHIEEAERLLAERGEGR